MTRRFITARTRGQAVDLNNYGFTWVECGKMLGVDRSSLRRAALKSGAARVYQPMDPAALSKARELRAQGKCWKAIGRIVGQNWTTLANYISKENVACRKMTSN